MRLDGCRMWAFVLACMHFVFNQHIALVPGLAARCAILVRRDREVAAIVPDRKEVPCPNSPHRTETGTPGPASPCSMRRGACWPSSDASSRCMARSIWRATTGRSSRLNCSRSFPAASPIRHAFVVEGSQYWSLVTYMLLHGDWMHLLFNCALAAGLRNAGGALPGIAAVLRACPGRRRRWAACRASRCTGARTSSSSAHRGRSPGCWRRPFPSCMAQRVPGGARPLSFGELVTSSQGADVHGDLAWPHARFRAPAAGRAIPSAADSGIAWEAHIGGFIGGLAAFYALAPRRVRPA